MSKSKARSFRQAVADQHTGSSFDSFLEEEGIRAEVDATAGKRVRALVGEPVSAANCTVNGSRHKNNSPAWTGLDFSRAELRTQSTIMLYAVGQDNAPYDLHLDVPWMHPGDRAAHFNDKDYWARYRVRPRKEKGARFYQREDGQWMLAYE